MRGMIDLMGKISARRREKERMEEEESFRREIIRDIEYTEQRLEQIRQSYDLVSENELIDAMIYEENSLRAKHAYLMRIAREKGIKCRMAVRI